MSVRKRLIMSNILMFLIPLFFGIAVIFLAILGFDTKFGIDQLKHIETAIINNDQEQLHKIFKIIEGNGYCINFQSGTGISYQSEGYQTLSNAIIGNTNLFNDSKTNSYMLSNPNGDAYNFILYVDGIQVVLTLLTESPKNKDASQNIINAGFLYMKNTIRIAIIGMVCVVALMISVLNYIISKSILMPLKLLQVGARQIKNGNLNYSINYSKDDEFGEVCEDFEDMRVSLLMLKEEERKYEENRKELIAGITHDLNTPLTSIKGFVSGLLEGIVNTPEKTRTYLQNIKLTADKMSKLVEELLLYSTLDMDRVSFTFEKIDMVEYFKDCLSEMQDELKSNEMLLHFKTNCKYAYARIDLMHFNRVVLNLLGNSVKYKKEGFGNIYIELSKDENRIILSFKDDGRGIPNTEACDIFKMFYRSDKSRNQSTGGNGLGLAIVQRIISAHNGNVKVNQEYIDGLDIVITLPILRTEQRW